jgi:riboflavin biosynthesis pyrimidine reductase
MTEVRTIDVDDAVEDHGYRPAPPGLRANMIFSADGAAAFHGRAGPLSGPADYQLLLALRAYADVVLVGAGTARAENYGPVRMRPDHLAQRRELGLGDAPPPIAVVSQSGRLPERLLDSPTPPILITSARSAHDREPGCRVIAAGDDIVDMAEAIRRLHAEGMNRILCEGGPTLLDELVETDLVDELCLTVAPCLAGSQPLGHGTPASLTSPTALRLNHVLVAPDNYLYLRYQRG